MKLERKHFKGYLKNLTQEEAIMLYIAIDNVTDNKAQPSTIIKAMQKVEARSMANLKMDNEILTNINYKQSKSSAEVKMPKLIRFIRTNQNLVLLSMFGWFIFFGVASIFAIHAGYTTKGLIFLTLAITLPYFTIKNI